jgi:transcriptional regulator with XRE-family HTH domain
MAGKKTKFEEFVRDRENQRVLEQESLALEATELISRLMDETKVSKSELAQRIGKSRAFVTQVLGGSRNMTMHTLADLAFALGYKVDMQAVRLEEQGVRTLLSPPSMGDKALGRARSDNGTQCAITVSSDAGRG